MAWLEGNYSKTKTLENRVKYLMKKSKYDLIDIFITFIRYTMPIVTTLERAHPTIDFWKLERGMKEYYSAYLYHDYEFNTNPDYSSGKQPKEYYSIHSAFKKYTKKDLCNIIVYHLKVSMYKLIKWGH